MISKDMCRGRNKMPSIRGEVRERVKTTVGS